MKINEMEEYNNICLFPRCPKCGDIGFVNIIKPNKFLNIYCKYCNHIFSIENLDHKDIFVSYSDYLEKIRLEREKRFIKIEYDNKVEFTQKVKVINNIRISMVSGKEYNEKMKELDKILEKLMKYPKFEIDNIFEKIKDKLKDDENNDN